MRSLIGSPFVLAFMDLDSGLCLIVGLSGCGKGLESPIAD